MNAYTRDTTKKVNIVSNDCMSCVGVCVCFCVDVSEYMCVENGWMGTVRS